MLSIVIMLCLISDPERCEEHAIPVFTEGANVSPMQCIMQGMPEIVKHMESYPSWQLRRFACVNNYQPGQDI